MRCKRSYPQPFLSRTVAHILNSGSQHGSDSSAVVPTVVTGVEGEEPCARPPPYDEATSMEGEGVYCYKCNVYRTNSWDKLYTHLRLKCLNTREKALLVNSYVHSRRKSCVSKRRPRVTYERRWFHLPWSAKARHSSVHRQDQSPCQTRYLGYQQVRPMYSQQACSSRQIQHRARQARCQVRHRALKARVARQERCRGFLSQNHQQRTPS